MDRLVTIRSSKYGLDIELDPEVGFDVLLKELVSKFRDSARFFKDATMALSFSGRSLSRSDEDRILKLIQDNTRINILCIIERNEKDELMYKSIIDRVLADSGRREGQVYRGTLRRGQILESEGDIVILGDVELGACVVADGSVIIVGNLYGSVSAGASGDSASYVVAVSMQPKKLRIAGIEAKRQIIYQESLSIKGPKIAVVEGRHIYLDPLVE